MINIAKDLPKFVYQRRIIKTHKQIYGKSSTFHKNILTFLSKISENESFYTPNKTTAKTLSKLIKDEISLHKVKSLRCFEFLICASCGSEKRHGSNKLTLQITMNEPLL